MREYLFTKLTGAGNDFILFDKKLNDEVDLTPGNIRKVCDRRYGIGADGVLLISDGETHDFIMEYFNADGSAGSLCGNGARCIIKYAADSGRVKNNKTKFICGTSEYSGEILDTEIIKFYLNPPGSFKFNFEINAGNQIINTNFVDTGSPHAVIKIEDVLKESETPNSKYSNITEFPVFDIGREIRYANDFAPAGTNVNFIKIENQKIQIRTYERGVENETLACGTGSVAAALISHFTDSLNPPIELITKGGEVLTVDFKLVNETVSNVSLTGPAKSVFSGKIFI